MISILICFCIFFFFNYRLLSLLEREDWPALAYYLEQKIYIKGRYSPAKVRLLASSYMVISDYQAVSKLENKASIAKPSTVEKNALIFGAARVLSGKYGEAAAFFKTRLDTGKLNRKTLEWVRWFYNFSKLLQGEFASVEPEFSSFANFSADALITGLSAYFLANNMTKYSLEPEACTVAAKNGRSRVINALRTKDGWRKETERMATEIHIAIIRKYVDEAGIWLFTGSDL